VVRHPWISGFALLGGSDEHRGGADGEFLALVIALIVSGRERVDQSFREGLLAVADLVGLADADAERHRSAGPVVR
jgi:hypothetical protein